MNDLPSYIGWYMERHMTPAPGRRVSWRAVHAGWCAWWQSSAWWAEPPASMPTVREFGLAMLSLCRRTGIQVALDGDDAYCLGVAFTAPAAPRKRPWWRLS